MRTLADMVKEIAESALLGSLEPNPVQFNNRHEYDVPRVRAKLARTTNGKLGRFRPPVNRNGFLLGCLDYLDLRAEEHLVVGYGFRHGSTTKIESVHHVTGGAHAVAIPAYVAHVLWNHYGRQARNEVILLHNHPQSLLGQLLGFLPLPSRADRLTLEAGALQPVQLLRLLLGQGRVMFFLQENGFVKEFSLPSVLAILARMQPNG